ncbi:MAG: lysophospholipid acyltransferase family protein [Lentisphaerae bacterium]|nr:lysophospholipid acyltransferase family protein [Lentisphaerota bacterium]
MTPAIPGTRTRTGMLRKARHILEYLIIECSLFAVDLLPLSWADRLVKGMADLWFSLDRKRVQTAQDNLLRTGIASDRPEAARIAKRSFHHFASLIVEAIKSDRYLREDNWRERVDFKIHPRAMELFNDPKQGIIVTSGHVGNWEISAQLLSYLKPVVAISMKLSNPYADRVLERRKPRNRFRIIPKEGDSARRFIAVLKKGEVLGIMIDQHAGERGMMIDVLGVPASAHTSPAVLHLVTGVPICFAYCVRHGPMKYEFRVLEPKVFQPTGDRRADIRTVLEYLTKELETVIRAHPDQYLWAHRRWR